MSPASRGTRSRLDSRQDALSYLGAFVTLALLGDPLISPRAHASASRVTRCKVGHQPPHFVGFVGYSSAPFVSHRLVEIVVVGESIPPRGIVRLGQQTFKILTCSCFLRALRQILLLSLGLFRPPRRLTDGGEVVQVHRESRSASGEADRRSSAPSGPTTRGVCPTRPHTSPRAAPAD